MTEVATDSASASRCGLNAAALASASTLASVRLPGSRRERPVVASLDRRSSSPSDLGACGPAADARRCGGT
eukprot:7387228-Prymnesium_polylepis.1